MTSSTAIAIIGMSGRFPGASTLKQFWFNLQQGIESIERFTPEEMIACGVPEEVAHDPSYVPAKGIVEDIAGFDAAFFGYSPREASYMDPQHRMFLECAWEALEHAGYDPLAASVTIGLYAGCGDASYLYHLLQSKNNLAEAAKDPSIFFGNYRDFFATRVAYRLNLRGPSLNIQTACSTSLVAIHEACSALLSYQCDLAVAGGIHLSLPHKSGNFHEKGAVVSPDGHCRAFDAQGAGTVASDGAGVVILKRLDDAVADGDTIQAIIMGSAVNNDGADKIGYTAPSVIGQAEVITMAQELAGISPGDISYIEAHGTGTPLGDPIEIKALTQSFSRDALETGYCAIGSLKTNIGHLDAAAGVAGLIKTVLALQHKEIPASLNFSAPNPDIDFVNSPFYVNDRLRPWLPRHGRRIAGVSSFGIGGTNAHAVIGEAPVHPVRVSNKPAHLLILSARSESALQSMAERLAAHLSESTTLDLGDAGFTLQLGRHCFQHRLSVVASDKSEAIAKLTQANAVYKNYGQANEARKRIAFIFPGQGLQCVNMGRALYENEKVFKHHIDLGARVASQYLEGIDLRTLLYPDHETDESQTLTQTRFAQPSLFIVEYALSRYLESLGLHAEAMLGHSIGEWVAGCLAGVFSFEDAIRLVCERARLMQACEPGAMLGVELSEQELLPFLEEGMEISVFNAKNWLIVSGTHHQVDGLHQRLVYQDIVCHSLRVSHAFHSVAMDPAARDFASCFKNVVLLPPQRAFISNVTGDWITDSQACSPDYWAHQLRAPVRFHDGVVALQTSADLLLLEVGPGKALGRFASMSAQVDVVSVWPQPQQNAYAEMLNALGRLWIAGFAPDWSVLHASEPRGRVPLPSYPFEHIRYWVDSQPFDRKQHSAQILSTEDQASSRGKVLTIKPPRKNPNLDEWFFTPEWQQIPANLIPETKHSDTPTLIILGHESLLDQTYLDAFSRSVIVRPGTRFRQLDGHQFEIELDQRHSYEELFAALERQDWHPERIIHAINLEPVTTRPPDAERALRRYVELLSLAQAMGKCLHDQKVDLIVLANQLCATPDAGVVQPDKATLLGPAKVIPLEYPGVQCRVLDLDPLALINPSVLLNELRLSTQERVVAYRNGQRWAERYISKPLAEQVPNGRLRTQGVYLITGGLGGVGLALAEYLVRTVQAKLVLVNRSDLPAREKWQSVLQAENLPELSAQLPELLGACDAYSRSFAIATFDQYQGLSETLLSLAQRCIQRYFSTVTSESERISIARLRERLKLHPRFERMFQFMLEVLRTAPGVQLSHEHLQMPPIQPVSALDAAQKFPAFSGLINFIDCCTQDYPKALSGEIPSIQVLYPEGKTTRLDALQKNTVEYSQQRIYSHVLKDHLVSLARVRPLRILEVGGGQGLLTRVIAPELLQMGCTYHFTDISPYFINRIVDAQPDLKSMSTGIFDLTRDPVAQGLKPDSYDVIVGLDVVHATPNISVTLEHLRMLLAPSGYLGLLETVSTGPWVDLCWGLADGWWLYEDQELRQSALMHAEQWETAIENAGFAHHAVLPATSAARACCDVALVLAQIAPGKSQISLPDWQAEASNDPATITRYRIKKLQELEQLGGEVAVVTADVSDAADVKRLVTLTNTLFGPVNGVIHSAMVLEDKLMQLKDSLSARRVFAPKVQGSLNLIAALEDQPLDFFAHCSSLAAPMGLYAQSDYCAATSFQDALAQTMMPDVSLSINWGVWRDAGFAMRMKLESAARLQHWQTLPGPILRRKLSTEDGNTIFEGELANQWLVAEHYLNDMATLPGTGYLSLINEALQVLPHSSYKFDSLIFSEPLTVLPKHAQPVRLLLEPEAQGYQVKVASLRENQWIEHARAHLSVADKVKINVISDTGAVLSNLQNKFGFSPSALDDQRSSLDSLLIYRSVAVGPRWQGLMRWSCLQTHEALALIELPARFENDLRQYPLHPSMLDIATSFAMGDEAFYLPMAYDNVSIHAPLSRQVWSYVVWERNAISQASTISFKIKLFNDDGALAIEVGNYTLRKIDESIPDVESRRLVCETPGLLDTLTYVPLAPLSVNDDEVEIRVVTTGLNFLDVLTALDMSLRLPDQETGIGRECAGTITRVGRNVSHLKAGDEVLAITSHAFDDLVVVPQQSVRLKPSEMSWEIAASVAVPFMTAHFALNHRARLREGESVLIHAAAGGVGLAAVQLALNAGAKIYATAGSEEKRDYLRSLGISNVYDSRSAAFAQEVRQANGGGVDVVLNSLGADLMLASLELLAPHGRFLELGKRDFAENRQVGMSVFAGGVTYYSINLGPDLSEYDVVFDEVMSMLANQVVYPLPVRIYPVQETAQAFADMASAKHIGKLVIARANHPARHRAVVDFAGVDAPMDDPQLREGMSSQEGSLAFDRALSSGLAQVLVTPQDFPTLLKLNTPAHIRSSKESLAQSAVVKTSVAVPVIDSPVEPNDLAAIVLESWQKYLGLTQIDPDDNFFKLGGDSLIGIQIMAYLRKRLSIDVPVAIFFEAPTLSQLTQALESLSGKTISSSAVEPVLKLSPGERFEPFALTDVQQAYWIGRSGAFELGNVAAHGYFEVERSDLDYPRFCRVWMMLVRRHDMLRMIVNADGQQQVLADVPDYQPVLMDLRELTSVDADNSIIDLRQRMSSQILPSDQWPLFDIRVSLLPDLTTRIHMSFDALIMDAWSSMILGREFAELYQNPESNLPELELSFRDYVIAEQAERQTPAYDVSKRYWLDRLDHLPPAPDLPLRIKPEDLDKPSFTRRNAYLSHTEWTALKKNAALAGLTPSVVCLTCFSEVLASWSQSERFSINLTLFNRPPVHPQINDVVGDFTSLTLLEIEVNGSRSFIDNAQRIQQQLGRDLDHRRFSGVEVLRELVRSGRRHSGAIMPVVFTSTLALESQQDAHSPVIFDGEVVYGISQTPQVWLDHGIVEEEGQLSLNWNAVEALFPDGLLDDMFEAYRNMLADLADSSEIWHQPLATKLPASQLTRRETYNATDASFNITRLETGFFEQALLSKDTPAVFTTNGLVSYGKLAEFALSLSNLLRDLQLSPGECVGVHLVKGWEQIAAALGILKAGGAYVALDPSLPQTRLLAMTTGMRYVISTRAESNRLPDSLKAICFEDISINTSALLSDFSLTDLAYVIFTSGSTGQPKGVMIQHQAVMNTIADLVQRFDLNRTDRVLALSAMGFDLSVFDMFALLGVGGSIVMPDPQSLREPDHWHQLMLEHRVTIWNSVPALMELLVDYVESNALHLPDSLRLIMLSGDWIPVGLPQRIQTLLPKVTIIGMGGATEASIWSIYYPVKTVEPDWTSIPYGYPLANQTYYVLNSRLQSCPEWVTGELYIGGVGLSSGYWQDPDQTMQRYPVVDGKRLYRTGDLGRFRPEGWIEFQGRNDSQVKVQGYRIELAEIESALRQHPLVSKCAVKALGLERNARKLAAYFVPYENQELPSSDSLRQFLLGQLPDYMVPRTFTMIGSMPLSGNGKVDYASLPDPLENMIGNTVTHAAQHPLRAKVLRLIGELLSLPAVSPDANLLDLGADSITVIRLANRLQAELSIRPSVAELYRMQSIEELLRYCEKNSDFDSSVVKDISPVSVPVAPLITDPVERQKFKDTHSAIRQFVPGQTSVSLGVPADDSRVFKRRSQRQFSLRSIDLADFGKWLGALCCKDSDGHSKYLYASAGGLYPVQTYVFVKAGRIANLAEGLYYHDPVQHKLVLQTTRAVIARDDFDPFVNRTTFDESAFCLFFVSAMAQIEPLYGEHSEKFASIETGLMLQILDLQAHDAGIGLCHIGDFEADKFLAELPADDRPRLILSALGGIPNEQQQNSGDDKLARAMARVAELSPEQVRNLLLAKKGQRK